ncbi:MAG: SGNH/GDSL hydrolase family protein [Proteobacteria bacterium]|nr:SGNH/GDSL hydrolase family protein [Pseudomonadota bacterium]
MKRRATFWLAYGALLIVTLLAGIEGLAWLVTPAWPGYLLRPAPVGVDAVAQWSGGMPDVVFATNRWQMRDRERTTAKPANISFRSLFVGDSFLEGGFTRAALPARVEGRLVGAGREDIEAINLGVAGTSPIEYYYRIKELGLDLSPDAVVLAFYSGNDTVTQAFPGEHPSRPFIAELPRPSILGSIAPHTTWQAVNALRLSGAAKGGKYAPNEHEVITKALALPRAQGLPILVKMMHQYYFPSLPESTIHEILDRGGERFWEEFKPRRFDREYLQGWILDGVISMETSTIPLPMTPAEADAKISADEIAATMSWLTATDGLLKARGVKLLVAVIPVGTMDPDFAEFWKPWPRYYSYTLQRAAAHRAMVAALSTSGIRFVDLAQDLDGVRGTYRKTDLHWTEEGHEVVAKRLATEVMALAR